MTLFLLALSSPASASPFGALWMPLTPAQSRLSDFHGLVKKKGAGTVTWTSDSPGFSCTGDGDFVEVRVTPATWPGIVPKKVVCSSELGTAKMRIDIVDETLQSMFVGDGTLVLPRAKGDSVIFKGDPPRLDLPVQQGNSSQELPVLCKIEAGPKMVVRAPTTVEDGVGSCVFRTSTGENVPIRVVLRTIKRSSPN